MYNDPLPAVLEVRLYNADNTGYRVLSLSQDGKPGVAPGVEARITSTEGYGEATVPLYGVLSDFPGLVTERRAELHARYTHPLTRNKTTELLYRGYVRRVASKKQNGQWIVVVKCYGIWAEVSKTRCFKRYANSAGVDKNAIFSDLFAKFVQNGRLAGLSLLSLPVGDVPDYVDAYNVTFGEAADKLSQNTGRVVTGGDVEAASSNDRLRFVPFDDPSLSVKHVLSLPSPQVGAREREQDASKQATVLYLTGGSMVRGRANLLAEAVDDNTSFEMPELAGENPAGGQVTNPSFEIGTGEGATGWTLTSGASVKSRDQENVSPFDGDRYVKLDHAGEKVSQINNPAIVTLIAGRQMVVSCRARRQRDTFPVTGELRVVWLTGSNAVIRIDTVRVNPWTTVFELFSDVFTIPDTATGFRVEVECTGVGGSGFDYALCVDNVTLYDSGDITQRGWRIGVENDARYKQVRWDEDSTSWHGGRCVFIDVEAYNDITRQAYFERSGGRRFTVSGGQSIVGGFVVKKAPGGGPDPSVKVEIYEWAQDGTETGRQFTQYDISSEEWTVITVARSMHEKASQSIVFLSFNGFGRLYIDGAFAFDAAAPLPTAANPDSFVEADQFRATLRAVDLFPPGHPIHDTAATLGDLPQSEERQEIATLADAVAYGRPYFEKYVPVIDRPNLETFGVVQTGRGSTASMWPGEYVRAIGEDGADLLPAPLPLVEKLIKWDNGKLTITPYLQVEPRDPARTIAEIMRRIRLGGRGSQNSSGGFSGGGGTTGGGVGTGGTGTVTSVSAAAGLETVSGTAITTTGTVRIADGGVSDTKIGTRTLDDNTNPIGNSAAQLLTHLSRLANRIKAITGETAWYAGPAETLASLKSRVDALRARTITAGTGLTGGGDLTADRTLAVVYGTAAGTAAQGNDTRITGAAQKAANLSDLASASTARTNLGLGTAATHDVPSTGNASSTQVVLGNDTRLGGGGGGGTTESQLPTRYAIQLLKGETPTGTGLQSQVYELPFAPDGSTVYFKAEKLQFRLETPASSGSTAIAAKFYHGTGTFAGTTFQTRAISSGSNEPALPDSQLLPISSPQSGDKIRVDVTALGTGAAGFSALLEMSVWSFDPAA